MSASGITSVGESEKLTPQSAKRETTVGSKSILPLSTGASGMRSRIMSTLYAKPVEPQV